MSQSSPPRDPSLDASPAVSPRRFGTRDLEMLAALAVVWIGAFVLNWFHVIP